MSLSTFNHQLSDLDQLRRYLCFGSEQGQYHVHNPPQGNIEPISECINRLIAAGRGEEAVEEIVSFSVAGRAAKYDYVVSALAMCARSGDQATKQAAYDALNPVCRIPTHLFQFIELCQKLYPDGCSSSGTGWDTDHAGGICRWYENFHDKELKLAHLVTKYRKRNKWSHKKVLRLAHLNPDSAGVGVVLKYITHGLADAINHYPIIGDTPVEIVMALGFLKAFEQVKSLGAGPDDVTQVCEAIRTHSLVREHVPTQLLKSVDVWKALLVNMPLNALLRNLGKMTSLNMFDTDSDAAASTARVIEKLGSEDAVRYARIHPFKVLLATAIYTRGYGELGSLTWHPNEAIITALDHFFYMSIKYVEPTGKRFLLAIDVGSSMITPVMGTNVITARQAAATLSMVTASREQHCEIVGFSETLQPIDISPDMKLPAVMDSIGILPGGRTDCAAPMQWAMRENKNFDVFMVLTDCKTEVGPVSPAHALREYRAQSGISRAKLIVCAFASNGFTLADPRDADMLDMAGFDGNGPAVMNTFIEDM